MVGAAVNTVSMLLATERFEPAICRFTEKSAVMVIIPASRSRTLRRTCIKPVTKPAAAPTARAAKRVKYGFTPLTSSSAVTAAPKGKLPSTVRSGKSSIL